VRVRRFAAIVFGEMLVDDAAVFVEQLYGMRRSEVAVGTERLLSMFSTILSAGPRSGTTSASAGGGGAGAAAFGSGARALELQRRRRFPASERDPIRRQPIR
jgi:hypothetical protein